jgi:hypothetical protein
MARNWTKFGQKLEIAKKLLENPIMVNFVANFQRRKFIPGPSSRSEKINQNPHKPHHSDSISEK